MQSRASGELHASAVNGEVNRGSSPRKNRILADSAPATSAPMPLGSQHRRHGHAQRLAPGADGQRRAVGAASGKARVELDPDIASVVRQGERLTIAIILAA